MLKALAISMRIGESAVMMPPRTWKTGARLPSTGERTAMRMLATRAKAVCSASRSGRNDPARVEPIQVKASTSGWKTAVSAGCITETNPSRMVRRMPNGERVLKMMSTRGCSVPTIEATPPSISVAAMPMTPLPVRPDMPEPSVVRASESMAPTWSPILVPISCVFSAVSAEEAAVDSPLEAICPSSPDWLAASAFRAIASRSGATMSSSAVLKPVAMPP